MLPDRRFATAVVIGKFCPPHRGHKLLIDTATSRADRVTVIVCAKLTDAVDGQLRGVWLRQTHPEVEVMVIDDRYDEQDSGVWAENTVRWLGAAPDAVFTSEDYGDRYAALMGSVHVSVDPQRARVPCSATMIRADPYVHWRFLEPPVREWYAKRICIVGAESTGTTTLAMALAARYRTTCTSEYGREYSAIKHGGGERVWTTDEFVHIAKEQNRRDEEGARASNGVAIYDTNSWATCLWHRRYVGHDSAAVQTVAANARCDLYILTGDEIAFVQDGFRDGEHLRHAMHEWFEAALRVQRVPWIAVHGTPVQRIAAAARAIDALFEGSAWRPNGPETTA